MKKKAKRKPNIDYAPELSGEFAVILSDLHAPYHSKACLDLVCRVIEDTCPDYVISVGDMLDMMAVMQHDKRSDQRGVTLDMELMNAADAIKQIDTSTGPDCLRVLVEGNHENRLQRYIDKRCPELAGWCDYKRVVDDWEVIPYGSFYRLGKLCVVHDVGVSGERSVFASEKDFNGNVVTGHTHLQRWAVVGNGRGDSHVTASGGWLGDPVHASYASQIRRQRHWSHGFNVAHILPDGDVFVQPVPIVNGRCLVNGKVYQ